MVFSIYLHISDMCSHIWHAAISNLLVALRDTPTTLSMYVDTEIGVTLHSGL